MDTEQFTRISKALADATRMEILQRIAGQKELACSSLAGECQVSQPTVSHHLKELAAAGLIKSRREGKFHFFQLDRKIWTQYLSEMRRRVG
jgi:ArsR family transcriptional regulator, arsenate/arsenite/antimonite-responsive transcriptional repressor